MKTAIHDVGVWLPRTKTWLYSEIAGLGEGWDAWVIANRTDNLAEFPFPRVYSLRDHVGQARWAAEMTLRRLKLTAHAPSIARHCASLNGDLLHSHFGTVGWLNLKLARRLDVPHVVTFYGFDVTQVPREKRWLRRYRNMFDEVSRVLCEGPHMAEQIVKLGCNADKVSVHRLGVRLDELPYAERHIGGRAPRLLMAGSFREKKGLTDGLTALGKLARARPDQDFELTIIGGPGEDPEGEHIARRLHEIAIEYDIARRIHYGGFLSHAKLIQVATSHDIFLCPSVTAANGDTEGGAPVVMIEMAAMGMPVIATTHCDIPYGLAEQNRALLAPERNVDALLQSLVWLLDNPVAVEEISVANHRHCMENFDNVAQGERLARLYDDVLGQHR